MNSNSISKGLVLDAFPRAICVADESGREDTFTVQADGLPLHVPGLCRSSADAWECAAQMIEEANDGEGWTARLMRFGTDALSSLIPASSADAGAFAGV